MSSSTKGVIATPNTKDIWGMAQIAEKCILDLVKQHRTDFRDLDNVSPRTYAISSSRFFDITFTLRGEHRSLCIFFDCDSDHEDLAPSNVLLHMGCGGCSEEVITTILLAFKANNYDVWLIPIDYEDEVIKL